MLFNSPVFLFIFFPLSLLVFFFYNKIRIQNLLLLFFSFFFLYFSEPIFSIYVLLSTSLDFYVARFFYISNNIIKKKFLLFITIFFNLLSLVLLKYLFFMLDLLSLENLAINIKQNDFIDLFLPLGISFITFTKISFLVDCFKKKVEQPKKISDVLLYVFLYPQLIAGPIIRYNEINTQILNREISINKIYAGISLLIIGLAKKVLIADELAPTVDFIFSNELNEPSTLLILYGTIAFTIQIFFDFSGYTDIAIGIGKVFGFSFPKNFYNPYLANSVSDFWSRWHITLTKWFKDYVYIPLGGNKSGRLKTYMNLWIVFFLSGLWHGASINFVLWGLFNGFFLFCEKFFNIGNKYLYKKICKIYFFIFILNSWLIFRIEDANQLFKYYSQIFTLKNIINYNDKFIFFNFETLIIFFSFVYCFIDLKKYKYFYNRAFIVKNKIVLMYCKNFYLLFILILSIFFISLNKNNNFIYFRF